MKEDYLKLLAEQIIASRKLEAKLTDLFTKHGGDVSTLDNEHNCPEGYYWNETAQKCTLDIGVTPEIG